MAQWQYMTLVYGSPDRNGRRWVATTPTEKAATPRQVGDAEKGRLIGRVWQAMQLLESALEELDAEGWELVSTSMSGTLSLYGTAVLRRPR